MNRSRYESAKRAGSHPAEPFPGSVAVLTVKNFWAQMLIDASRLGDLPLKKIENRPWSTTHRGTLIIHAGKGEDIVKRSRAERPELNWDCLWYGAALGAVTLEACVDLEILRRSPENEYTWVCSDQYAEGPVCWVVSNPIPFSVPVPIVGQLGLFYLPRTLFPELDRQWQTAAALAEPARRHIRFGASAE